MTCRLFLALFSLFHFTCFASDTIVSLKDLRFKNEAEKTAFYRLDSIANTTKVLDLFLTPFHSVDSYSLLEAENKINKSISILQSSLIKQTEQKRVKIIYQKIHKEYLDVYKLKNSFSEIFERGEYNCVSATALYSIFFNLNNIPYQIKETPQHVFLIAYPETHKILIETTSPEKGYFQFNKSYAESFVKNLYQSKLISKLEYETNDVEILFNKYFFSSGNISLVQLAGLQYTNYGIFHFEQQKFEESIESFKKAYYLYPSEKTKYMLRTALLNQGNYRDYNDQVQFENFLILCKFNNIKDKEVSNQLIEQEFRRLLDEQLIRKSDYIRFENSFSALNATLLDSSLKNNISFDYHYELGRLGYLGQISQEKVLFHLQSAYKINSLDANLQGIILTCFGNQVQKCNDVKNALHLIQEYEIKFSFINSNSHFNGVKANCLLGLAYQHFSLNEAGRGDAYLKEFETLYAKVEQVQFNPLFVEKAYAGAAGYYYRKGNYGKSKEYLKNGLKYIPGDFGLEQRLRQF